MRLFSFETTSGRPFTSWVDEKGMKHRVDPKTSKVVTSAIFAGDVGTRVTCFHIGQGGFIPRHPATGRQLFAVVEGTGWVSGDDGKHVPVKPGIAACWEPGEAHESGTDDGMKAIVVECESFDPAQFMREIRF